MAGALRWEGLRWLCFSYSFSSIISTQEIQTVLVVNSFDAYFSKVTTAKAACLNVRGISAEDLFCTDMRNRLVLKRPKVMLRFRNSGIYFPVVSEVE